MHFNSLHRTILLIGGIIAFAVVRLVPNGVSLGLIILVAASVISIALSIGQARISSDIVEVLRKRYPNDRAYLKQLQRAYVDAKRQQEQRRRRGMPESPELTAIINKLATAITMQGGIA